jgi:hypothetical protein
MFSSVAHAQAQRERDLLQARVENAEADLERERGVHRRELRRKGKVVEEVPPFLLAASTASCRTHMQLLGRRRQKCRSCGSRSMN